MPVFFPKTLGPIPLDVIVREDHESELEITRNPIEFGADVTDHAYILPKRLTIEGVMASRGFQTHAQAAAGYNTILGLQAAREPFAMLSGLRLYTNMLIERVDVQRSEQNSRILHFRASLLEVIIVDTETTSGGLKKDSLQKGPAQDRGAPTVSRGNISMVQDNRDILAERLANEPINTGSPISGR